MSVIKLKLLIDPERNKVVFAESEKEFVDILLSLLTLPIGAIIRLLKKESPSVGCIDNIYNSVKNLDTKYLNTKACQTMLLEPRNYAGWLCEDLSIKVDDLEPRRLYKCPNFECYIRTKAFSLVEGVNCSCGESMNDTFEWIKVKKEKQEVFLNGEATYIISDDLHVFPAKFSNAVSFFQKLGIDDVGILEKQTVDVTRDELLNILKMLLLSKTLLTDVFLKNPGSHAVQQTDLTKGSQIKMEDDPEDQDRKVILKLMRDKNTKRVLYAEVDHVIVDTIFSFLTFPLGSIVKLFNKLSNVGCLDNLYNSIDILASKRACFVSEDCKKMLLSPCLMHYNSSHQILKIESEVLSRIGRVHGCNICWDNIADNCEHNSCKVRTKEINPKMPNLVTENGGGYTNKSTEFMVTDDMIITVQSLISEIDVLKDLKVSLGSLILEEIALGEAEVMNLLKACLTSSGALNSVFSSAKKPRLSY